MTVLELSRIPAFRHVLGFKDEINQLEGPYVNRLVIICLHMTGQVGQREPKTMAPHHLSIPAGDFLSSLNSQGPLAIGTLPLCLMLPLPQPIQPLLSGLGDKTGPGLPGSSEGLLVGDVAAQRPALGGAPPHAVLEREALAAGAARLDPQDPADDVVALVRVGVRVGPGGWGAVDVADALEGGVAPLVTWDVRGVVLVSVCGAWGFM